MSGKKNIVFGIDLGTTYSCIAYVDEYGRPVVLKNYDSDNTTPSVVLFEEEDNIVVGKDAKNQAIASPDQVVEDVKRSIGDSNYRQLFNDKEYRPEEISALILRKVVKDANEKTVGLDEVKDVVITCPAYFGSDERDATRAAGEIAGLNVLRIINEPTAAAIAYSFLEKEKKDQTVLVYDLGGGTFDITMIEIRGSEITVIATGGDDHLGGKDWDKYLVAYLADRYKEETGDEKFPDPDFPEERQELYLLAENGKKSLTSKVKHIFTITRTRIEMTRAEFEEVTQSLLEQSIMKTKEMLNEAKQKGYDHFDQILLVGGSSKMPQVAQRLEKEFVGIPLKLFDPDEIVAKGAAIYGSKLVIDDEVKRKVEEGQTQEQAERQVSDDRGTRLQVVQKMVETSIADVTSRGYGVVAVDKTSRKDYLEVLIKTNDPVPAQKLKRFGTLEPNQPVVFIKVMETLSSKAKVEDLSSCKELNSMSGVTELLLTPDLPAGAPIDINLSLNEEGVIHLTGTDVTSGKQIEAKFETQAMTKEEVEQAKQHLKGMQIA